MGDRKHRFIVDEQGRRTEVVLPIREYQELLEDLHDLAVVAERKAEPSISIEELKEKLRANGTL